MYLWRKDSGFFFQMRIPARQAVNLGATPLRIWLGTLPKREAQRRATALAVVAGEGFNSGMDKETLTRSLKSLAEELASSRRAEFSAGLGVLGARSAANEEQAYGESADPELVSHFRQREARASGRKEAIITARRRLETIGQALEIDAAAWTAERETYRDILSMGVRAFTRTIIELFDGKRRYLIPLYQRQYAWKVTPQLELLWDDIERAARKLEQEGHLAAPHFMGAIVISQVKTFGKQVQAFEVIDGQQRLTTFQLLLTALRDVAAHHSPEYAHEVMKYLINDGVMEAPEVERFKLWPSLTDRASFIQVVDPNDTSEAASFVLDDEQGVVRPPEPAPASR